MIHSYLPMGGIILIFYFKRDHSRSYSGEVVYAFPSGHVWAFDGIFCSGGVYHYIPFPSFTLVQNIEGGYLTFFPIDIEHVSLRGEGNRQLKTDYRVFREEWDERSGTVILVANGRVDTLRSIKGRIGWDVKRLKAIIGRLENSGNGFTVDDIVEKYLETTREQSYFRFMEDVIARLKPWASIAKNKNIPISVISEGMGHDSETTTQIYLASLDSSLVDKANEMILKNL